MASAGETLAAALVPPKGTGGRRWMDAGVRGTAGEATEAAAAVAAVVVAVVAVVGE